jgi:hypothetical protein
LDCVGRITSFTSPCSPQKINCRSSPQVDHHQGFWKNHLGITNADPLEIRAADHHQRDHQVHKEQTFFESWSLPLWGHFNLVSKGPQGPGRWSPHRRRSALLPMQSSCTGVGTVWDANRHSCKSMAALDCPNPSTSNLRSSPHRGEVPIEEP